MDALIKLKKAEKALKRHQKTKRKEENNRKKRQKKRMKTFLNKIPMPTGEFGVLDYSLGFTGFGLVWGFGNPGFGYFHFTVLDTCSLGSG